MLLETASKWLIIWSMYKVSSYAGTWRNQGVRLVETKTPAEPA